MRDRTGDTASHRHSGAPNREADEHDRNVYTAMSARKCCSNVSGASLKTLGFTLGQFRPSGFAFHKPCSLIVIVLQ